MKKVFIRGNNCILMRLVNILLCLNLIIAILSKQGFNRCRKSGCSGNICSDKVLGSTCEWRPEYACYREQNCVRNKNGRCTWDKPSTLERCLRSHRN
jgi:hypothetical protein